MSTDIVNLYINCISKHSDHRIYIKTLCNSSWGQGAKKSGLLSESRWAKGVPRCEEQYPHQVMQSHRPWAQLTVQVWPHQTQSAKRPDGQKSPEQWDRSEDEGKKSGQWVKSKTGTNTIHRQTQAFLRHSVGKDRAWTCMKLRGVRFFSQHFPIKLFSWQSASRLHSSTGSVLAWSLAAEPPVQSPGL